MPEGKDPFADSDTETGRRAQGRRPATIRQNVGMMDGVRTVRRWFSHCEMDS